MNSLSCSGKVVKVAEALFLNEKTMAQRFTVVAVNGQMDSNGKPRPINQLPEPLRTAVTKIVVSGENYTYELGGKLKSMELLGKMTNLWKENQPVLMPISIAERDEKLIDIFTKALERNVPCPPGQTNRPSPFEDDE